MRAPCLGFSITLLVEYYIHTHTHTHMQREIAAISVPVDFLGDSDALVTVAKSVIEVFASRFLGIGIPAVCVGCSYSLHLLLVCLIVLCM